MFVHVYLGYFTYCDESVRIWIRIWNVILSSIDHFRSKIRFFNTHTHISATIDDFKIKRKRSLVDWYTRKTKRNKQTKCWYWIGDAKQMDWFGIQYINYEINVILLFY